MATYTYQSLWQSAQTVRWRVVDLIGPDKPLNFNRPFLPEAIARVADIPCLSHDEKLKLNHIRGNSYLHLFTLVEQFIIPMVLDQVKTQGYGDICATQALLGFAAEEGKHIDLFQQFASAFEQGLGQRCQCIGPTEAIAARLLQHHPMAVLLLTLQFEWTTQSHYLESVRNNHEEDLDPRFCDLLKYHWQEEAQHTRLDTLLIYELRERMPLEEIAEAITYYLTLVHLLHDALMDQVSLDLLSLESVLGRRFSEPDRQAILTVQQQAYRWSFLCAGLIHPNFLGVLGDLSPVGKVRVTQLAKDWS